MNEDNKTNELAIKHFNKLRPNRITPTVILDKIDQIRSESGHIFAAIELLINFEINDSPEGGIGDAERAKAIASIVTHRETTRRLKMKLLERMYDDLIQGTIGSIDRYVTRRRFKTERRIYIA